MNTVGKDQTDQDIETLVAIVKEMAASFTGEQSTRHWSTDALWFDIPAFASRGIAPAKAMFDRVFGSFQSREVTILETETIMGDDMGIVCSVQKVDVVFKTGAAKTLLVRETDCFKKSGPGEWQLVHQHASVPSGGDWDGKILTEA